MMLSGISAKKQCYNATVVLVLLLPRGKKDTIRRGNINITNRLLEEESGKHELYFLKHSKSWLNVDRSLNINLFYENDLHLIKEGNELLAKGIKIFYKELSFSVYNPSHISYKNIASFSYNTDDFPSLPSDESSRQSTAVYIPIKPREQNGKIVSFSNTVNPLVL